MNCMKQIFKIMVCLFLLSANAFGGNKMEFTHLYEKEDLNKAMVLPAQTFKISGGLFGSYRNVSLFPVPFDNAVGSNDMGNAITIISFPKGKIDYDRYFRNAADDMSGGGEFVSQTAKDILGYGQVRRFLLFDFKKKLHREYRIVFPITQYIQKIALADPERKRFLFEIESQKRNAKDPFDADNYLQLIDLSDDKHKVIKQVDVGVKIWTTTKDRIIIYDLETEKLQTLNMNLEPSHHPLENAVNKYEDQINFTRIAVHPYQPFAFLYGGKKGATAINWSKDRNNAPHLLIRGVDYVSFSPDGKWVAFQKDYPEPKQTYLMPVSEKYPHYLGSPILLADTYFNEGKFAWTSNPTGFVGSSLDKIYRWDLEMRDFPQKGKMSFHDYVVQKDLEKLAKEKRQGLGK